MKKSIARFRNEFTEGVLNFVWRQWCRLGVAGITEQEDPWIIDPEPLLAITTEVARHDARMFDEVMDWLVMNGRWINVQRLSTMISKDNIGDKAVAGAIASWMAKRDKSMKWRGLAQRALSDVRKPREPLFRAVAGNVGGSVDHADANFRSYGLIRKTVRIRGMAQPVNTKNPANMMFKSRAVFGIGTRADVMAYLIATEGAHPRDIARTLGYNHMRVQSVLAGLAEAGIAFVKPAGRVKRYGVDRNKWRSVFMEEHTAMPAWMNWRPLTRGLTAIWRRIWTIDETRADEYVFSSQMRSAMQSARADLLDSGPKLTIEDDGAYAAEAYLAVFMRDTRGILKVLGG